MVRLRWCGLPYSCRTRVERVRGDGYAPYAPRCASLFQRYATARLFVYALVSYTTLAITVTIVLVHGLCTAPRGLSVHPASLQGCMGQFQSSNQQSEAPVASSGTTSSMPSFTVEYGYN